MAKLTYYYNLLSQPCRAIYMIIKKNEIPFEGRVVDLLKGEQFTEKISTINPFNKVPIIVDKEFVLTESIAILRYICRTYNLPDHWYPKDSIKQARVDEYLEWQHLNTRANCALYFLHKVIWPLKTQKPINEVRVAQLEKKMNDTLDLIENVWLKDKHFLCGDEISISDVIGICEIEQPTLAGYDPYANRPNLIKWKQRVVSYFGPIFNEVNEVFVNSVEQHKKYAVIKSHI